MMVHQQQSHRLYKSRSVIVEDTGMFHREPPHSRRGIADQIGLAWVGNEAILFEHDVEIDDVTVMVDRGVQHMPEAMLPLAGRTRDEIDGDEAVDMPARSCSSNISNMDASILPVRQGSSPCQAPARLVRRSFTCANCIFTMSLNERVGLA